jgi:DNA-binding XRE family transcriptional regulator
MIIDEIKKIGNLVGEIESISPRFCKKLLLLTYPTFMTNRSDFDRIVTKILETANELELSITIQVPTELLEKFNTQREYIKFSFWDGYMETMTQNERKRIGSKIAELRKAKNFSQSDLAELVGMTQGNIGRIETGKYSTGIDILTKISFALDVELSFISDTE